MEFLSYAKADISDYIFED